MVWAGETIPDYEHEPRARVLAKSRTRQFSGLRSRWFPSFRFQLWRFTLS